MNFSLLLQSRHWSSTPEFMEEMGSSTVIELPADHTQITVLRSYQDAIYDWVKDYSGSLPPEFSVNFEDDFERLYQFITGKAVEAETVEVEIDLIDAEVKLRRKSGGNDHMIAETVAKQKKTDKPKDRVAEVVTEGPQTVTPCTDCTEPVENQDRLDLSMLRYREPLCAKCFNQRLSSK